jgi:DNA-binding CsgD family transcriptional regulator
MANGAGDAFCQTHGLKFGDTAAGLASGWSRNSHALRGLIAETAQSGLGGKLDIRAASGSSSVSVSRLFGSLACGCSPPALPASHLVLIVVRMANAPLPAVSDLRGAFSLTGAEAAVTLALASGKTGAEVAAERGVSVTTVRSQVRTILEKAGAGSLRELTRMVATLPQ